MTQTTNSNQSQRTDEKTHPHREKSLFWEKFQVIATAVLSLALLALNVQQYSTSEDRQDHEVLSAYLDQLTQLQLDDQFTDNLPDEKAKQLANAATLNTFRRLDGGWLQHRSDKHGKHKGQILKFLYTAGLIGQCDFDISKLALQNCEDAILSLEGAQLDKAKFELSIPLYNIDLTGASLTEVMFKEIDLTEAKLSRTTLTDANLEGAILTSAEIDHAELIGANLSDSKLSNAQLMHSKLDSSNLREANLAKANLSEARLVNANLQGADLTEAILENVDLRNVDLTKVKSLNNAVFKGAEYNYSTDFPEGFDPDSHGMKLCARPIEQECQ
jgi:uncharacterized protein YjbI with pentapeptide repeats